MLGVFKKRAREIPEDVSRDLYKAVDLLVGSGVPISEIRLHGSLHDGGRRGYWDMEESDIDVAVIFGINDERYSCLTEVVVAHGFDEYGIPYPVTEETAERMKLRRCVEKNPALVFGDRYELHMATPQDLKIMWREGAHLTGHLWILGKQDEKSMIRSMLKGRLLYPDDSAYKNLQLNFRL